MTTILMMIDGMRPDAIDAAGCSNLQALRGRSSHTTRAQSVMPSVTLPCHMSIFHSVPPSRHGVITNDWMPMARPLPGLIELAKAAGKRCGFFYNWEPLRNLSLPGNLACSYFRDNCKARNGDQDIAAEALWTIKSLELDFAFVYLGSVDEFGHLHGWMTEGYLEHLNHVDGAIGLLLDGLPNSAHVLIQSDHGGHDRSHGTDSPEDMTIPWMVTGPQIRPGHEIQGQVSLLDTAPTLARIMGFAASVDWEGRIIDEVFE
jgi:hypothetical protein